METSKNIAVAALGNLHRRVLEEVIGQRLHGNQHLIISVIDVSAQPAKDDRPAQSLEDWTGVYEGLSDGEIEAVDKIAKTRAKLTRHQP